MDEKELRTLLARAVDSEPGLGPVVDNAIRAGARIKRRRRVLGAVGCVAAAAVVAGAVPVLGHALSDQQPPATERSVVASPSGLAPTIDVRPAPGPSRQRQAPSIPDPGTTQSARPGTSHDPGLRNPGQWVTQGPANGPAPASSGTASPAATINPATTVYAVDANGDVFGVNSATDTTTDPIPTNGGVLSFVMAPGGQTAYALLNDGLIVPVDTASGRLGTEIQVPSSLSYDAMAISPDGSTIFLSDEQSGFVLPIDIATGRPENVIPTGGGPGPMAFSLSGATGYVLDQYADSVTAFSTVSHQVLATIRVGKGPVGISAAPSGTVYVVNASSDTVTPINSVTNRAEPSVRVGISPGAIVFSSTTAYVANGGSSSVTPINLTSERALPAIPTGQEPGWMAIAPSGSEVYVANSGSVYVTPINTGTNQAGPGIRVGTGQGWIVMTANGSTVFVDVGHSVVPISTATNTARTPIGLSAACCVAIVAP